MIGQYVTVHGDVISHVNISHVMVEDGGEYSCIAENRAGKVTHSARLNIYGTYLLFIVFCNLNGIDVGHRVSRCFGKKGTNSITDGFVNKCINWPTLIFISEVQLAKNNGCRTYNNKLR